MYSNKKKTQSIKMALKNKRTANILRWQALLVEAKWIADCGDMRFGNGCSLQSKHRADL